jgi:adenosylhomocysteine nucleosidase
VVGVAYEARGLARRLGPAPDHLLIRTAGLGAARLPDLAPEAGLAAVLVTGLCGGCAPDLAPGDLVVGTEVGPPGGPWLVADPALARRAAAALRASGLPHRPGRLLTVPAVVGSPRAKAGLWRAERAVAVDMESAHVLRWAAGRGMPAVAVRAVADAAGDEVPDILTDALGPGGELLGRRLAGWVSRPRALPAAWRLWRRSSLALDRLACFLRVFAAAPRP